MCSIHRRTFGYLVCKVCKATRVRFFTQIVANGISTTNEPRSTASTETRSSMPLTSCADRSSSCTELIACKSASEASNPVTFGCICPFYPKLCPKHIPLGSCLAAASHKGGAEVFLQAPRSFARYPLQHLWHHAAAMLLDSTAAFGLRLSLRHRRLPTHAKCISCRTSRCATGLVSCALAN